MKYFLVVYLLLSFFGGHFLYSALGVVMLSLFYVNIVAEQEEYV